MDKASKVLVLNSCKNILGVLKPQLDSIVKENDALNKTLERRPSWMKKADQMPEAQRVRYVRIQGQLKDIIAAIAEVQTIYKTVAAVEIAKKENS